MPDPLRAPLLPSRHVASAFREAIAAARRFRGATAPNPPVGCVILDEAGERLAVAAHSRAGAPHAEAAAIEACRRDGTIARIATVVVTLEPCNHWGRTPPCTQALLATPARQIWIGAPDPDASVAGGGERLLRDAGLAVHRLDAATDPELSECFDACRILIAPFAKQRRVGRPWVTVKQALDAEGSMIPPSGRTTFTSEASLTIAHRLRRRADAVMTGSGTILADDPAFTVRRVEDHPGKRRRLVVLDRRRRVPASYLTAAARRGFDIVVADDVEHALDGLGRLGVLEVLVEAGPSLTASILERRLHDDHVVVRTGPGRDPDTIEVDTRLGDGWRHETYSATPHLDL